MARALPASWDACLQQASRTRAWTVVKGEDAPLPANDGFWFQRHHVETTDDSACEKAVDELDRWLTMMRVAHPEVCEKVVRIGPSRMRPMGAGNAVYLMEAFAIVPKKSLAEKIIAILSW